MDPYKNQTWLKVTESTVQNLESPENAAEMVHFLVYTVLSPIISVIGIFGNLFILTILFRGNLK